MKVLAIEREIEGADWGNSEDLLKEEAQYVYSLYLSDALREIYFNENNTAILVLEAEDQQAAQVLLEALPLVNAGMIRFEVMALRPYTGYQRIMQNK